MTTEGIATQVRGVFPRHLTRRETRIDALQRVEFRHDEWTTALYVPQKPARSNGGTPMLATALSPQTLRQVQDDVEVIDGLARLGRVVRQ